MTLICGLRLSQYSGIMGSDERVSSTQYYELSEKIEGYSDENSSFLIAGTGTTGVLHDVKFELSCLIKDAEEKLPEKRNDLIKDYIITAMTRVIENRSEKEAIYLKGCEKNEILKDKLAEKRTAAEKRISDLDEDFLVLVRDKYGTGLNVVSMASKDSKTVNMPFECIGSGTANADRDMESWLEKLTREQRNNIDPVFGISAILYTQYIATTRYNGCGGTPLIRIILGDKDEHEIITPSEVNTKLASELVCASYIGHYLKPGFVRTAVDELMLKNGSFHDINTAMEEHAKKYGTEKSLQLFLRGYKQEEVLNSEED